MVPFLMNYVNSKCQLTKMSCHSSKKLKIFKTVGVLYFCFIVLIILAGNYKTLKSEKKIFIMIMVSFFFKSSQPSFASFNMNSESKMIL